MKGSPKEIGSILFFTNILILIEKEIKILTSYRRCSPKNLFLKGHRKKLVFLLESLLNEVVE